MIISSFSSYDYNTINGVVTNTRNGKVIRPIKRSKYSYFKIKSDDGTWKSVSESTIKHLCGIKISMKPCAKIIPTTENYYCDTLGNIYSFDRIKSGLILSGNISSKGYVVVNIKYKGKTRNVEVHQLVCATHIMHDYIEKGLVCLHADNDKTNNNLSNLSVGTYSKNNKDAYSDGINKGNGLKKIKTV